MPGAQFSLSSPLAHLIFFRLLRGVSGARVPAGVRTLAKLGMDRDKRMRFLLQMMQLFYSPMMGKGAIVDGLPFQQHLGPVRA